VVRPENQLPALERRPSAPVERLLERASRYAEAALAPATRRACERDFRNVAARCAAHGQRPLPAGPAAVGAFLAGEVEREFRPGMIARRAAAIAWFTAATTSPARATPRPCGRPWRDVRGLGIRVIGGAGALALFLTVKPTAYSLRIVRVSVLTTERSRPQRRATRVVWQAAHQRGALHHPT
jgi:hypothetical protein